MADFESFHDVLFPVAISFGATGGPERLNEIVTMTSGRERRNARFAHSRRRYDAGTGIRSLDDLAQVAAFFEARRGSLHAFRFRDPFEAKSCGPGGTPEPGDQPIATGDGASARLRRGRGCLPAGDLEAGRRQRAPRGGRRRAGRGHGFLGGCRDR